MKRFLGFYKYLGQEDTTATYKVGAVAIGSLAGYISALRGGLFRKVLFTSVGGLGMASICYPKEAVYYTNALKSETTKYARIGYHFYHGGKPEGVYPHSR